MVARTYPPLFKIMPFPTKSKKSGKDYFLHIKEKPKAGGGVTRLFYFSGDPTGAEEKIPDGYHVVENERTGLPFLKKNA